MAALLLLIRNPTCLFDPGTQLSFLAVLAIMRGFTGSFDGREPDRLQQLVRRSRPWFQRFFIQLFGRVCRLTWISLLIWGATAPLVLHYFHVLSHAGILLNLVLYLPMVVVMFSGLGIWILGEVPVLVELPAWICRLNLVIIESTVEAVEGCRGSHVWGPGLPVCWLFGLYAVIAVGDYLTRRFRRWYHSLPLLLLLVGAGIVWPLTHGHWFDRSEGLRCTFIAVGHGTCVLLEMPDGQTWLYDAGAMGRPQTSGRRIAAVLWSRGIVRLDMVVLSHADADHYNAIPYLLDRFDVRQIGLTAVMADQLAGSCPGLYRAINSADVEISHWQAGDSWQLADGVELEVIQPPAEGLPGNDNSNSLVMVVH